MNDFPDFKDLVGNIHARKAIIESVIVSKSKQEVIPNILAIGSSGCGKTALAKATAKLINASYYEFMGQVINKKITQFVKELKIIKETVSHILIFIDEVHQLSVDAQEAFYEILDDKKITIFAATTDVGNLIKPFQNRFTITVNIYLYNIEESIEIIEKYCINKKIRISQKSKLEIANRSKGVARQILQNIDKIYTKSQFKKLMNERNDDIITHKVTLEYFHETGVDEYGLCKEEQRLLDVLLKNQILSLTTLSSISNIDEDQIRKHYEPYLIKLGFITKTTGGRMLSLKGREYMLSKVCM